MRERSIRLTRDVERVWKKQVKAGGRIETCRSVRFADGCVIRDRVWYPYFCSRTDERVPEKRLGYRVWWNGCQRCGAWSKVICEILQKKGDMEAFKFAMAELVLVEERWMAFFVCEDCVKLRRAGIRRDPVSKRVIDWGREGAYPPPIHENWHQAAIHLNRFGEQTARVAPLQIQGYKN